MPPQVSIVTTAQLSPTDLDAIRRLMDAAFDDFGADDWQHALGGWHALIRERGAVVAHAALVERRIRVGEIDHRAGYVEAVGVAPDRQRQGLGTAVMAALGAIIQRDYDLGVLSSGEWSFYGRLGWERWQGPAFVRQADGAFIRTPDEDEGVMALRAAATRALDPTLPIACDARSGDAW